MLHELKQVGCNAGLIIKPAKTFLLTNHIQYPITLEAKELKWVIKTLYLGQTISFENRILDKIEAWRKFLLDMFPNKEG